MNLIAPSVSKLLQVNPFKHVETIARTCYKSEGSMTDTSHIGMVSRLIKRQHFAMLEHGTICANLNLPDKYWEVHRCDVNALEVLHHDLRIPYTYAIQLPEYSGYNIQIICNLSHLFNPRWKDNPILNRIRVEVLNTYIPDWHNTPFGAIFLDMDLADSDPDIKVSLGEPALPNYRFQTFKFVCDRGVSHELVRHRCSVAQESTRYCNYSLDKFSNNITFIKPFDWDTYDEEDREGFISTLECCEREYMRKIKKGATPQQARAVLPNALKTEVLLTMPMFQWYHFINLRYLGTTGDPHPDMKVVAKYVAEEMKLA